MRDYEKLIADLREMSEWIGPDNYELPITLYDRLVEAADAIEELAGFIQEAERDRDEYRERLDKANDAIEELVSNANKFKWVSVEKRLPKLGEEVLVYYRWINPPEKGSITRDFMHIHDISMEPVWHKHKGGKVTHWMPLPEPPKEEI